MRIDTLKEKLADIDADTLRDFVFNLYLRYPELNDKIEALTLANDPVALSRVLGKRIASLRHCVTASLRHCVTASLRHCVTASLRHCVTASRAQVYRLSGQF
jgi:hypothetical protein